MSLIKNNNSGPLALKKNLNLTAQVAEVIRSMNKKTQIKNKTSKLTKTMNNKGDTSNRMTENDIDKLFGRPVFDKDVGPTKVSTEGAEAYGFFPRKNFTRLVRFLQMDDSNDKFLTGLSELNDGQFEDSFKINNLFCEQTDLTANFKKNYLVGKIIGQGAYASVRVAIYKPLNKKIAIKIYQKLKISEPQRKKSVRREIKILQELNHPNIVKILDVVETNNHLNIVMEYLCGTSLGSYLKSQVNNRIFEGNCKQIFKNLTMALRYMHSMNIGHRDIKLQNIILDEDLNPKLIDFGFSTCIQSDKKIKIFCGTPSYMAPQVVQRKQYRGEAADVWALGVMLFVCLTGVFPFKGSTDQELYKKINSADYQKTDLFFSRPLSDLISRMFQICPQDRITAQQVLMHPWFLQNRDDSKKKNTQNSLQKNRKRVNTMNSVASKEKWGHKTGVVKKVLLQTTENENTKIQIQMGLKSPKLKTDLQTNRIFQKQNKSGDKIIGLKLLKSEKTTHRGKQSSEIKQSYNKTHSKVLDLLRGEFKKRESDKSKGKKRF